MATSQSAEEHRIWPTQSAAETRKDSAAAAGSVAAVQQQDQWQPCSSRIPGEKHGIWSALSAAAKAGEDTATATATRDPAAAAVEPTTAAPRDEHSIHLAASEA
jgi:hypothetical protein